MDVPVGVLLRQPQQGEAQRRNVQNAAAVNRFFRNDARRLHKVKGGVFRLPQAVAVLSPVGCLLYTSSLNFGNTVFVLSKPYLEYTSATELSATVTYPSDSRRVRTTVGLATLCPVGGTAYEKVSKLTMQTLTANGVVRAFGSGFTADDMVMAACLVIIQYHDD